jgi:hypothetical protein
LLIDATGLKAWYLLAGCFNILVSCGFENQQPKKKGPLLVQTGRFETG